MEEDEAPSDDSSDYHGSRIEIAVHTAAVAEISAERSGLQRIKSRKADGGKNELSG